MELHAYSVFPVTIHAISRDQRLTPSLFTCRKVREQALRYAGAND